MNRLLLRSLAITFVGASICTAFGQVETGVDCFDPMNMMPLSNPYSVNTIFNDLMVLQIGVGGTATFGGQSGPCWTPAVNVQNQGKFAFGSGPTGSNQQTPDGFSDDLLPMVFGAFDTPAWTYAATSEDGTRARFGVSGLGTTFVGFSNRYQHAEATNGNVHAVLQAEVVADAIRLRWTLNNLDTTNPHNIGLFFGGAVCIAPTDSQFTWAHLFGPVPGYVYVDKNRPPVTDVVYDRALSPSTFPSYVDFTYTQADYFGFRMENEPSAATSDVDINEPATATRFWLGKAPTSGFLIDGIEKNDANFPLQLLPDTEFLGTTAFCQEFGEETVPAGGSRRILHYIRSTWGNSDYKLPFGATVDAPTTIGLPQGNNGQLFQNPFPVRVYVDNVGGFAFDGKEFQLNEVRIKVHFDPNSQVTIVGASAATPYELERTIAVVQPRDSQFVDFQASVGADVAGGVPYTVTVDAQPGFVHKEIKGVINVAARPRLELHTDANMITLPYHFGDTSFDTIFTPFLDPNVPGGDLQFYQYDSSQKGYVIINTAQRGRSFWAIYSKTGASPVIANYGGDPTQPSLESSSVLDLHNGFNMIGNPYNYRIPIQQINGVAAGNNQISRTFQEMVDLGYIQSFVSHWDPDLKDYVFTPALTGYLEPHQGYWINVLTTDDLSIAYPPVFYPFVPDTTRSPRSAPRAIAQVDREWMLKLSARTQESVDLDNAIGVVRSQVDVNRNIVTEPPMAPENWQNISLSIRQSVKGKDQQMARAFTDQNTRNEWKVIVTSKKAGDVTVTWPNLSQVPKNVRFTIKDAATNVSRQLRQTSGYTFRMDKPGTRELTIVSEPGGVSSAVIGNVVVSGNSRAKGNISVTYTLAADATTSVRILSNKGSEVYVISRGRADRAGENTVTWNLRNSANQAVAPGSYKVEILAENGTGDRVRRIVPVNVIR